MVFTTFFLNSNNFQSTFLSNFALFNDTAKSTCVWKSQCMESVKTLARFSIRRDVFYTYNFPILTIIMSGTSMVGKINPRCSQKIRSFKVPEKSPCPHRKKARGFLPSQTLSQGRSTPCIGDGKPPTFNSGNPYNGYINPYYWVDDQHLLYGNNVSLDPSTYNQWLWQSSSS